MSADTAAAEPMVTAIAEPATRGQRAIRAVVWLPGIAVALAAAVVTAHGLYMVAFAAGVPAAIAWLYPLITDGLAVVAYFATTRLRGSAASYAWLVVVLAAGLSGLAQAALLGSDTTMNAPTELRYGVGAWPAVAAAIVAHLLYLLATHTAEDLTSNASVQPAPSMPAGVHPAVSAVQPALDEPVQSARPIGVEPARPHPVHTATTDDQKARRSGSSPARDRAQAGAERYAHRHGRLPTVSELAAAADVSRGTAATALHALRDRPADPQPIPDQRKRPTVARRRPRPPRDGAGPAGRA